MATDFCVESVKVSVAWSYRETGQSAIMAAPYEHSADVILTGAQMRAAEAASVANGASGVELMERAGAGVAAEITRRWAKCALAIVCGPGKNGGDGFVVARLLKAQGWPVRVTLLGRGDALAGEAAVMAARWGGAIEPYTEVLDGAGLIVDALFGTGLSREVAGDAADVIRAMAQSGAPVVSIDIPSGVDADTGHVRGVAVAAEVTVTFAARKPGHFLFPGRALDGDVVVVDIGVGVRGAGALLFENAPSLWKWNMPCPDWNAHKYARGHAAVLSGPRLKTGAARLAARAALRAGAGAVTLLSPRSAADENAAHVTAVMICEADGPAEVAAALADKRFTCALVGPGAGVGEATANATLAMLSSHARAVLDADALTSFETAPHTLFQALRADDIMTPHHGEFRRLFRDHDPNAIGKLEATRRAAAQAGCCVVFKGADTVIAAPDGRAAINANAPSWLATAGSGDVLAGITAGLLAQGMQGFEAACAAVWLHGAAGATLGQGLIAEDLESVLPDMLRTV